MSSRFRKRTGSHEFKLFHPNDVLGMRVLRTISFEDGENRVNLRVARQVLSSDGGRIIGYQLLSDKELNRPQRDIAPTLFVSNASISAREMELNAGTNFKGGKSATVKMTEAQRLARVWPAQTLTEEQLVSGNYPRQREGKPPAEDRIERVVEKVRQFGEDRLVCA